MGDFLARDMAYVIRLDEIVWGGVLLALTLVIHGAGMFLTLRLDAALLNRTGRARPGYMSMTILILAAWMIILFSLIEVTMWAGFFVWRNAQPNIFSAYYNAMLNYTTLQAGYLPLRWRLLEGILGMAGLLTFAWSTSILFSLAQELTQEALQEVADRKKSAGDTSRRFEAKN